MKKITLKIRQQDKNIFDWIVRGEKTIETRAATKKYKDIGKGDTLIFACGLDRLEKTVIEVNWFRDIVALAQKCDIKKINPAADNLDDLVKMYSDFPGYPEKIAKYGIIAFLLSSGS